MNDLIKALIGIKDPFTLTAFVSVVLLFALRTKTVPELFFGILKEKLTRAEFAKLLHRTMAYGVIIVIILCGFALLSQFLAYKVQARPATAEDIKSEIQNTQVPAPVREAAESEYEKSLAAIKDQKFEDAVTSLQASLVQVQTLSAEYTLAYVYLKLDQQKEAAQHAELAAKLAEVRGDTLSQVKVGELRERIASKSEPLPPSPGDKHLLPVGGNTLEKAVRIVPGQYSVPPEYPGDRQFFRMALKANQTLTISFITSDNQDGTTRVRLYDRDTSAIPDKDVSAPGGRLKNSVQYNAPAAGDYFVGIEAFTVNDPNAGDFTIRIE